jgi:hypothetical protein
MFNSDGYMPDTMVEPYDLVREQELLEDSK